MFKFSELTSKKLNNPVTSRATYSTAKECGSGLQEYMLTSMMRQGMGVRLVTLSSAISLGMCPYRAPTKNNLQCVFDIGRDARER